VTVRYLYLMSAVFIDGSGANLSSEGRFWRTGGGLPAPVRSTVCVPSHQASGRRCHLQGLPKG